MSELSALLGEAVRRAQNDQTVLVLCPTLHAANYAFDLCLCTHPSHAASRTHHQIEYGTKRVLFRTLEHEPQSTVGIRWLVLLLHPDLAPWHPLPVWQQERLRLWMDVLGPYTQHRPWSVENAGASNPWQAGSTPAAASTPQKGATPVNPLHIHIVLDRSSSMDSIRTKTISAVNAYLSEVAADHPEASVSLTFFPSDGRVENLWNCRAIHTATLLPSDYAPSGMTPLYDAVGKAASQMLETRHAGQRTALVIVTDGMENASINRSRAEVQALIAQCQKREWLVTFLGANFDAVSYASGLGVNAANAMAFTTEHTSEAMQAVSRATRSYSNTGNVKDADFTSAERTEALKGDAT